MKASSKKSAKLSSRSNGKLKTAGRKSTKTASSKQTAKQAAKKSVKRPRTIKSTVPPQFRELKRLAATNDPRFWTLRREFRDYLYTLPDEEVEPFLEGLEQPFLDYLVMAVVQERGRKKPVRPGRISEAA
ncbi:MAG: hypothetical protein ACREBD_17595 [Blastocatellia bacterium]